MPHVCGDEPDREYAKEFEGKVCPTYVGMNRCILLDFLVLNGMPHVCGDEPDKHLLNLMLNLYAPRMWG